MVRFNHHPWVAIPAVYLCYDNAQTVRARMPGSAPRGPLNRLVKAQYMQANRIKFDMLCSNPSRDPSELTSFTRGGQNNSDIK